jgi:glutamine amidotransferase
VARLDAPGLKIPHIGWSPVSWRRESELTAGLPDPTAFYHVHSFAPRPAHDEDLLGVAEYGTPFASVVSRANVHGAQFHPEKSGPDGLALLRNFAGLGARAHA